MEWSIIISCIALGLGLIILEIIFIPGTTVVGIAGFCLAMAGVVFGFVFFGRQTGWITLAVTAAAFGLTLYLSLRVRAWDKFALKSTIESKVNEGMLEGLSEGLVGKALSALRPMGKADFNGKAYEVSTYGNFVDSGTTIKIVTVKGNQILVEPVNQI